MPQAINENFLTSEFASTIVLEYSFFVTIIWKEIQVCLLIRNFVNQTIKNVKKQVIKKACLSKNKKSYMINGTPQRKLYRLCLSHNPRRSGGGAVQHRRTGAAGGDINNPPCYSYANAHGTIISGTRITRRYTDWKNSLTVGTKHTTWIFAVHFRSHYFPLFLCISYFIMRIKKWWFKYYVSILIIT